MTKFSYEIFDTEFIFRSSRSGGKGGQNVNKVETKIELLFDVANSKLIDSLQKEKIMNKLAGRIDSSGVLRITSQTERTQLMNKRKAVKKFFELLEFALKEKKQRKPTSPDSRSVEKRLKEKKITSGRKQTRKIDLKNEFE